MRVATFYELPGNLEEGGAVRKHALALGFAILCTAHKSGAQDARPYSSKILMEIAAEQAQVNLGEPLTINITLTNVSSEMMRVCETNPEVQYQIQLTDSGKQLLEPTAHSKRIREVVTPLYVSTACKDMKPGDKLKNNVEVTRLYKLKSGLVQVKVSRTSPDRDEEGLRQSSFSASSNTISIVIRD